MGDGRAVVYATQAIEKSTELLLIKVRRGEEKSSSSLAAEISLRGASYMVQLFEGEATSMSQKGRPKPAEKLKPSSENPKSARKMAARSMVKRPLTP